MVTNTSILPFSPRLRCQGRQKVGLARSETINRGTLCKIYRAAQRLVRGQTRGEPCFFITVLFGVKNNKRGDRFLINRKSAPNKDYTPRTIGSQALWRSEARREGNPVFFITLLFGVKNNKRGDRFLINRKSAPNKDYTPRTIGSQASWREADHLRSLLPYRRFQTRYSFAKLKKRFLFW